MATETFSRIRTDINNGIAAIDAAVHQTPVDVAAVERELQRLRQLSDRIAVLIERLRETWG
ncbi:MAG: hypothetical protein WCO00_05755 [Rhodospirillaceae bacterium]